MTQRHGFTLLELIVVLVILGFMAAMILPRVGRMSTAERIKLTQDRLEQLRSAIVGPRYRFDAQGRPIIGGYVGDVGSLPELVRGRLSDGKGHDWTHSGFDSGFVTDSGSMQWVWDDWSTDAWTVDTLPLNHPAGLFDDPGHDGWAGPYLGPGKDPYRNDHSGYADTVTSDETDRRYWALRLTSNRLNDAWGRSLLFWVEDVGGDGDAANDSLWIISEGANMRSEWTSGVYNKPAAHGGTGDGDDDDLVLEITDAEWYPATEAARRKRAEEEMKDAFYSSGTAKDILDQYTNYPACFGLPLTDPARQITPASDLSVSDGWENLTDTLRNIGSLGLDPWGRAYQVHQYDGPQEKSNPDPPPTTIEVAARRPIWLVSRGPDGQTGTHKQMEEAVSYTYYVPPEFASLPDSTDATDPDARRQALVDLINDHRGRLETPLADISLGDLPSDLDDLAMDALVALSADDVTFALDVH